VKAPGLTTIVTVSRSVAPSLSVTSSANVYDPILSGVNDEVAAKLSTPDQVAALEHEVKR